MSGHPFGGALRTALDRFSLVLAYMSGLSTPWGYAVSGGQVVGKTPLFVTGQNGSVPIGGEPIWNASVAYTWQVADQTLTVRSTSAFDTLLGTGAQTIRIWWLDAAGAEHTTDFTLDGVNPVTDLGATTARRVNRMEVLTAGVGGRNAGVITVYATDNVTPMYSMYQIFTVSTSAIQTVPAGKVDYIERICFSEGSAGRLFLVYRLAGAFEPWVFIAGRYMNTGGNDMVFATPIRFPAGTDYYVYGEGVGGSPYVYSWLSGWREAA
jgi:hypothetical protein